MFSVSRFEKFTCLTNIEFGTVIKFKFLYTYVRVFFMFGVMCSFVCEMSMECVVYNECYVVFQFSKNISYYLCGFVTMG